MKSKTDPTPLKNADPFKSDYIDREPALQESRPTGPLKQGDEGRRCSLLLFVPRNVMSTLVDDMTGGYGYSHLAVDCGDFYIK